MRKTLNSLRVSPSLVSIPERVTLLRQTESPLCPFNSKLIYTSLLESPALQLDTKIFNSLMNHSLLYYNTIESKSCSLLERKQNVYDTIMNYVSDMTHLKVPLDGTTYSLLIQVNQEILGNTEECISLFREASAANLALHPADTYARIIDILVDREVSYEKASSESSGNPQALSKSQVWEVYSSLKRANIVPSFSLFSSLINAFTHLKAGREVKKIYSTVQRLAGLYPEQFGSNFWPASLYVAVLNAISTVHVDIGGKAGDEKVVNKLMYLIRKKELAIDGYALDYN